MTPYQNAIQVAQSFGGKILPPVYFELDQSYTVEAEAPDGKQWMTSNSVYLVARYYSYIKGSKDEAMNDLIERMKFGLEDFDEELNG
jgi:hypothetical protein